MLALGKLLAATAAIAAVSMAIVASTYLAMGWDGLLLALLIPCAVALINGAFYRCLLRIVEQPAQQFVRRYATLRAIKFGLNLLVFGFMLAIIFACKGNILRPLAVYIAVYFVFFIHEIATLYTQTNKRKGANNA